jgi:hypothetical protein
MSPCHKAYSNPAPRLIAASGLVITLAALVGVLIPASLVTGRARHHAAVRAVIPAADAMYDTAGLFVLAGSTVLLLVWLQQQAFGRLSTRLSNLNVALPNARKRPPLLDRDRLISLHFGGLYGP